MKTVTRAKLAWLNPRKIERLLGLFAVMALVGVTDQRTASSPSEIMLPNGMTVDTGSEPRDKSALIQVTAQPLKAGEPLPLYPIYGQQRKNYFGIRCVVTNMSKKRIAFLSMTCSWWSEWMFSDKRVNFCGVNDCTRNFPQAIILDPGETFEHVLPLTLQNVQVGDQVRFRIGFCKDIRNGYVLLNPLQRGVRRDKVYWSEPVVATASDTVEFPKGR